jgi:hypothetical protein
MLDEYYETPDGWVRSDEVPDVESVKDHMYGVLESMYKTGDVSDLERSVEEICAYLNMPFPTSDLKLKRA